MRLSHWHLRRWLLLRCRGRCLPRVHLQFQITLETILLVTVRKG